MTEPIVEREETPDGRYVLYFRWQEEPPERDVRDAAPRAGR